MIDQLRAENDIDVNDQAPLKYSRAEQKIGRSKAQS
jgi:hypothetical protein